MTLSDTNPVMEFASFRLAAGTDHQAFLAAADQTDALLRDRGSMIRRSLTVDADALWTDVVQWRSLADAKSAAKDLMTEPAFQPFLQMISPESVSMRHAEILLQME